MYEKKKKKEQKSKQFFFIFFFNCKFYTEKINDNSQKQKKTKRKISHKTQIATNFLSFGQRPKDQFFKTEDIRENSGVKHADQIVNEGRKYIIRLHTQIANEEE